MAQSGISVDPDCLNQYNELKMGKSALRYIIYKIADNGKDIVVDSSSKDTSWDTFRQALLDSKSKDKAGKEGIGARYAVYDFHHTNSEGVESAKPAFIAWIPNDAKIFTKMTYSSSKEALKRSMQGLAADVQANDENELEYDEILPKVFRRL